MWDSRARAYNRMVEGQAAQTRQTVERLDVDPEGTVLDIGSGPGTLAVPLAKIVKHVTAVDPSSGMLECLQENAVREGLENITCVNKRWEDVELGVDAEPCDVVTAYNCLIMPDMEGALRKMDLAAKRRVYLFRFAGGPAWDYEELWGRLYEEEFAPLPDYIYIVNILHQIGVYANVEIWERESGRCFSSLEEAVQDGLESFVDPPDHAEAVIRDYLSSTLVEEGGGLWSRRRSKLAMIWWGKHCNGCNGRRGR
jgi:SAM-dependent methyltransferase